MQPIPILMKRKDGTITPYRNAEFIPAYLFIPEEIIQKCPQELKRLPRQVGRFFRDWNTIEIIESDLFLELIIDAYAYMVWPYMDVGGSMERFSGYEPAWIFAHSPGYWIQGLMDAGVMPTAEELGSLSPEIYVDYVSLEAASALLSFIVPLTMEKNDIRDLLEGSGASNKKLKTFEDTYEKVAPEDKPLMMSNIYSARSFDVKTPDVVIKVKPDRTDLVNEQNVDGKDCIVIELNGEVVVNGINVRSDSEA